MCRNAYLVSVSNTSEMCSDMEREFRQLLLDLSENITEKNFKNMKFYNQDKISKSRLEKIEDCLDLFSELETRMVFSFKNVEPLQEMIKKCTNNNHKLLEMITRFQNPHGSPTDTNVDKDADKKSSSDRTQDFRQEFSLLRNYLGKDWKSFIRELNVPEPEIEIKQQQNQYDLKEAIGDCLKFWLNNLAIEKSDEEIGEELINCLKDIERNDLVAQLESLKKI